jgi:hypothetical protein
VHLATDQYGNEYVSSCILSLQVHHDD